MSAEGAKVTKLSAQVRDKSRVNVFIDGSYRFSLDITQIAELGVRVGAVYEERELLELEHEGLFSKVYTRSLEYALTRPRSQREMRDYLYRKIRDTRLKDGAIKKGISSELADRVFTRLAEKGYLDDEKFARFWIENRNVRKGSSMRKIKSELMAKGIESSIIERLIAETERSDDSEIMKIIAKKAARYDDRQKLMRYLASQGFSYDTITAALSESEIDD